MQLNIVSIYVALQANTYVVLLNEFRINIYCECLNIFFAFQRKRFPKTCLHYFLCTYVLEKKKMKFTVYAVLIIIELTV